MVFCMRERGHEDYHYKGPFQLDGCQLPVLLSFSCVEEKRAFFPTFSSMLLLVITCQQFIGKVSGRKFKLTFSSNDFFQASSRSSH